MSSRATATAVDQAQTEYDAIAAERRRRDSLKAREDMAEARLIEAQENHIEAQQKTDHDLAAANRRYNEAKAATVETFTAFVEAREELQRAQHDLTVLNARARSLGIEVPEYVWLSRDVKNDSALRALQERGRIAIRDGIFGSR